MKLITVWIWLPFLCLAADGVRFRADSNLVLIPVSVTDSHDRPVPNLGPENFRLFEDGVEQKLASFFIDDAPVSVAIVLDFSNSMSGSMRQLREAASQFLKTANPTDEFCLIEFGNRARVTLGLGADPGEIQNRLAFARAAGQTALIDAVVLALGELKHARHSRRAIFLVTDGGDNNSRYSARELRGLLRESGVAVYAIRISSHMPGEAEEVFDRTESQLLDDLAEQSGGRHYPIASKRELVAASEKAGRLMRDQYLLGYAPAKPVSDGKYRRVQIKVLPAAGQHGLSAFWRRGYYAL